MFARVILPVGLLLVVVGCFSEPKIDASSLKCRTEQNCPTGYQCVGATAMTLGYCMDSATDAGRLDAPIGSGGFDGGAIDSRAGEPGNALDVSNTDAGEGSTAVDSPTSANYDLARFSDDAVGEVPSGVEVGTDAPITGNGGAGGANGSGGTLGGDGTGPGTGGKSGSGGIAGAEGGASGGLSSGGAVGAGGAVGSGGDVGSGGVIASGGSTSTGGTTVVVDCGSLAKPENGSVFYSATTVGNTAEYACTTGYGPSGSSTRYCLANGTWSGVAPSCVPANCPGLPSPPNGLVSAPALTYSSTATYSCSDGYQLTSAATRTCQADGTWSGSAPTCVAVDCGALTDPSNGKVSAATTTYNSTATYSCSMGYNLSDTTPRTCQANKQWSGSAPICVLVDCGPPASPSNGNVTAQATKYGSTASYSCSFGYTLSGTATRTCQADGSWSDTEPTCSAVTCGACASGLVCERIPPAVCGDPSWAEWPMPNCLTDVGSGAPNAEAYTDNGDGTVTDNVTALMWQQSVSTSTMYAQGNASSNCSTLTLAGHTDWRLPTIVELTSIMDYSVSSPGPTVNIGAFPGTPSGAFWTATMLAGSSTYAWIINTYDGSTQYDTASAIHYVRCVR
jgi:hypothetical protein